MPNSSQQNAFNGAQSTGRGVIYDQLGNPIVIGAQMPVGAGSGKVVASDASGNLTLQSAGAGPGALLAANNLSDVASASTSLSNLAGLPLAGGTMAGPIAMGSSKITGLANGTASTDAAAFGQVPANWGAADQGLIAWNYDGPSSTAGSSVPLATAGTLYTMAMTLRAASNITNIIVGITTNGSTLTSGQCFAALYQGFGGALLGVTADQASNWGSGGTTRVQTMAIVSGPVAAAAGVVIVALWFNGTTGPAMYRTNATPLMNAGLAGAASRWGTADTGKTTTAPSTLGTVSAVNTASYWAALS